MAPALEYFALLLVFTTLSTTTASSCPNLMRVFNGKWEFIRNETMARRFPPNAKATLICRTGFTVSRTGITLAESSGNSLETVCQDDGSWLPLHDGLVCLNLRMCSLPAKPKNYRISWSLETYISPSEQFYNLTISCPGAYKASKASASVRDLQVECHDGGKWSHDINGIGCEMVTCPFLRKVFNGKWSWPRHGKHFWTERYGGAEPRLTCPTGFKVNKAEGSANTLDIVCQNNGTWSLPLKVLACEYVATCRDIHQPDLENAFWAYMTDVINGSRTARLHCPADFKVDIPLEKGYYSDYHFKCVEGEWSSPSGGPHNVGKCVPCLCENECEADGTHDDLNCPNHTADLFGRRAF